MITSLLLAIAFGLGAHPAQAVSGRLLSLEETAPAGETTRALPPKIVVALGFYPQMRLDRGFQRAVQNFRADAAIEILQPANGASVVRALRDPDTVGLVLIAHSYKTPLGGSVLVLGDGHPLPSAFLSAATSALRFVAVLSCGGAGTVTQYQVRREWGRLPGQQVFYFTEDKLLGTGSALTLGVDGISRALSQLEDRLRGTDLRGGEDREALPGDRLEIEVKDVRLHLEPRYVFVDGRIVGVIGGDLDHSNAGTEWKTLSFQVASPSANPAGCRKIKIQSGELTTGSLADDYLVRRVAIGRRAKIFEIPLHLGDDEAPRDEKALTKRVAASTGGLKGSQLAEVLRRETVENQRNALSYVKAAEWLDRDAAHWPALGARFFAECL